MPCSYLTTLARWGRVASRRQCPTARRPGGSPRWDRPASLSSAPGRRVVALGEVEGMPHPVPPDPASPALDWPAIPEACPPGEGMSLLAGGCGC